MEKHKLQKIIHLRCDKMNKKHILKLIAIFVVIILFTGSFISTASNISKQKKSITKLKGGFNSKISDFEHNIDDPCTTNILYPLSSIPAFAEKGGNFTINFKSNEFDNIYVYISTAYESVVDEIDLTIEHIWEDDSTWYATVSVPFYTPEELYNITLVIENDTQFYFVSRPRAVSIIDEFPDDFSIIHLTDLHIGDPRGLIENIKETIGWKAAKKCVNEINLLHPDFVIISGDLVFGQLYPFEYTREYKKCFEILQGFDVPTFLCPGNHDGYKKFREDGLEFWKEYFGPLYYSFDYGNYHFLSINSFDWAPLSRLTISFIPLNWGGCVQDKQLQWIEDDLADSDANLNFMFLHHNPLWDTKKDSLLRWGYYNRNEMLSLIETYDVDVVMAGHVHYDDVTTLNDTLYLTTTTASSSLSGDDAYWGYRLIEIKDGQIASYNYKEPKFSIPSYNLNYKFEDAYTAIVKNDLEKDVNVTLKFSVPKRPVYFPTDGKIIQERQNSFMKEIYVRVKIEKESEKTVSLSYLL